jgi:hypothetical protein
MPSLLQKTMLAAGPQTGRPQSQPPKQSRRILQRGTARKEIAP